MPYSLIILIIVLVIFGGAKLKGLGSAVGKNIKDFKDEMNGDKGEEHSGGDADHIDMD